MLRSFALSTTRAQATTLLLSRAMAKGAKKAVKVSKKAVLTSSAPGGDISKAEVAQLIKLVKPGSMKKRKVSSKKKAAEKAVVDAYAAHQLGEARAARALERKRLTLKSAAIAALPEDLRALAMEIDTTPFPPSRRIPLDTPPDPNFEEVLRKEQEDV